MESLFPPETFMPAGFQYHPDFITVEEETRLIKEIQKMPLRTFIFQGFEAKRKVASFGQDWSFEKRALSKGRDVPESFGPLINKTADYVSLTPDDFAEVLLTEYPVGSVINWHRDAPPFDLIAGVSLLSDCTFRFRPQDKSKQGRSSIAAFPVKRRSLYIIQGAARTEWQHSILPVISLRYSITLRTLKKEL